MFFLTIIVLIVICLNENAAISPKYDELIYTKLVKKSTLSSSSSTETNNINELQKTIQNILMIEHYSRDNLQQYKMIYECNEKLKTLEIEFNSLYLNDEWNQKSKPSSNMFTITSNSNNNSKTLRNTLQHISFTPSTKITRQLQLGTNLSETNMLENVRRHLVDYLKYLI
jgi:hypothetical protein